MLIQRAQIRLAARHSTRASRSSSTALRVAFVPLLVPVLIFGGLYSGAFTTTEAGAVVALFAIVVARFYYRNVSWREIFDIAYESGILTAAVILLTAVATSYQYLLGVAGVPKVLARDAPAARRPYPWLFLIVVAMITMVIGMMLEGLPAAVLFVPVVYPDRRPSSAFIRSISASCRPPRSASGCSCRRSGSGCWSRCASPSSVFQHAPYYWPYAVRSWSAC